MISTNLQYLLIILTLGLIIILLNNIRKYKLELRYTLLWIVLSSVSLLLTVFPNLLFVLSKSIYIETPVNALYLVSFIVVYIILYNMTVLVSRLSNQNKKLTQEIGLLKNKLNQVMEENIKKAGNIK
ncbi:DUF2304 domain-containing protein [Paenibacillus sp. FSL M7-1455]|uniref:DUF2304 domain-containing protein n=1 Tax=Paenibacillus sp. FSL M7-1455 TaxID=2975316 RepID=UPI0030FA6FC3